MGQVLEALAGQWGDEDSRTDMVEAGQQVIEIIDRKMGVGSMTGGSSPDPGPVFSRLYSKLSSSYDPQYGGYSGPPKAANCRTDRLFNWSTC